MTELVKVLFRSVADGQIGRVREILAADPNLIRMPGLVRQAVDWENIEMVRLLLQEGASCNDWTRDDAGYYPSAMVRACQKGLVEIIRIMLEKHADPNAVGDQGELPLHSAASSGKAKVCELLLESGANPINKDKTGKSPLHWAAIGPEVETMQILIPYYQNISEPDDLGYTPLHHAVFLNSRSDQAQLLLLKGADANAANNNGDTPLHLSALAGNAQTVEILINNGANINARNMQGITPIYCALAQKRYRMGFPSERDDAKRKYSEVIMTLKSHGAKCSIIKRLFG